MSRTQCSGNRPVCVRCLNRGLLCEYSVRETHARSVVRTRPIPSPNPFQVNGSGRPTPAYHSRLGQSQTNAYDRSPRSYGALTSTSPLVPPSASLPPLKSRSVPGNGHLNGLASHRGLVIPRTEHEDRYTSKKHSGSFGPELGLWEMSPPQSQSSASSDFDHRRQAIIAPYAAESHQDKGLNYDYMGPNLTTEQAISTSAYTIQSEERSMLHPQTKLARRPVLPRLLSESRRPVLDPQRQIHCTAGNPPARRQLERGVCLVRRLTISFRDTRHIPLRQRPVSSLPPRGV